MRYLRYAYLFILMFFRNIRWVIILLFYGRERPWRIMNFQMNLSARKAGLDPKENSIYKQLILDRIREQKATEIMRQFIQPDDVILELGANIGYYVCLESTILSNKGYIYAVEPSPENIELLKKNIALNDIKNIEVSNMAVSDKKGTAKLYIGKECNLYSLIKSPGVFDSKYVKVETDTVDNFLRGRKPITFLRMDIEGYEATVIDAMQETLKSPKLKKMFIEVHPHKVTVDKMQNLLEKLQNSGFEIKYAISHDNWQREVLGHCKVEEIAISQLAQDKRVLERKNAFEVFFEKIK